jgi:spore coat protein CotF
VISVEFRYANAGDVESSFKELNVSVLVSAKENRLLILQMQLFRAESPQERQFLQAQIDQLLREIKGLIGH